MLPYEAFTGKYIVAQRIKKNVLIVKQYFRQQTNASLTLKIFSLGFTWRLMWSPQQFSAMFSWNISQTFIDHWPHSFQIPPWGLILSNPNFVSSFVGPAPERLTHSFFLAHVSRICTVSKLSPVHIPILFIYITKLFTLDGDYNLPWWYDKYYYAFFFHILDAPCQETYFGG